MNKTLSLLIAAIIVGGAITTVLHLIGWLLDNDYLLNWHNDISWGATCSIAGLFGPILGRRLSRKFSDHA